MPIVKTHARFPSVILLIDSELYNEGKLKKSKINNFLANPPDGSPISNGSHDFFVFHPRPEARGGRYWGSVNHNTTPQPKRGLIRMGNLLDPFDADAIIKYL